MTQQHISRRITVGSAILALAMGFAALAGIGLTKPAGAITNCSVSDLSIDAEEQAFLGLINQYRAQNGLGALSISTNLTRSAVWHGADMGAKNYFSHTDSLGRSPSTRAMDCGYPTGAGQNIAAGTNWSTAQSAFTAWKNSSGHNANMLYGSYKQIGIARVYTSGSTYGWYWVTDFGTTNDGTSGGGATNPTPTPTQPPVTGPASISSPSNGSTLPGASATFSWAGVAGAQEYFFYAGTAQGANNITGRSTGTGTSATVTNLPTNGSTVYVRLWTRFSSGWQYRDYTYRAATVSSATTSTKATMASPAPGSQFSSTSVTFNWNAASGAQQYFLYVGTSQGSNNIVGLSTGLNRSLTVNNIPRGGQTLYVRLWTLTTAGWQYNDYWYFGAP